MFYSNLAMLLHMFYVCEQWMVVKIIYYNAYVQL